MLRHVLVSVLLIGSASAAKAASDVNFTADEIELHRERVGIIAEAASKCLDRVYQDHLKFHSRWRVSKYYGNRHPDYQKREGRIEALLKVGRPVELVDQMEPISCIGLTLKCLDEGFTAAGMKPTWNKIYERLASDRGFYGTDLQKMLRKLGWKTYYWNADSASNEAWDEEDKQLNPLAPGKQWNPVWGGHTQRHREVMTRGVYYNIPIDDNSTMVDFQDRMPDFIRRVPFFVGTAHAGYHVFPGRRGYVIEAHSMRDITAKDNLEAAWFNPLAPGGGPRWTRSEKYRSGVIVVPDLPLLDARPSVSAPTDLRPRAPVQPSRPQRPPQRQPPKPWWWLL